jgi:hypothetical protein
LLLPSHFYPPTSTFLFQVLSPCIFFFFLKKNTKKKKTIEKKKMQRKEGTYLQGPTPPFHFWFTLLPSYFCPFISSAFS